MLPGGGEAYIRGVVTRPPQPKEFYTTVFITPVHGGFGNRRSILRLNITGNCRIKYGDIIEGKARLDAPSGFRNPDTFNWADYANLKGEEATASAKSINIKVTENGASPPLRVLYGARENLGRAAASLSGPAPALYKAMILGDQSGVTDEMRDVFQASGTTHLLSVSGSHVALFSTLIFVLVSRLFFLLPYPAAVRLSARFDIRKLAAALAIPAAFTYAALAGFEVATVRALIMITAYLGAVIIEREAGALNILSLAALAVLLIDPSALFDISFILSYLSVLFMAISYVDMKKLDREERLSPLQNFLLKIKLAVVASAVAIAGTAPLVAREFNTFSWVALPANMIAVPVAGAVLVPLGLLSSLLSSVINYTHLPLSGVQDFAFLLFYWILTLFASAPYANIHPPAPGMFAVLVFYASAITFFIVERWRIRAISGSICCICVCSIFFVSPHKYTGLKVTFLDVGQGDCSLVEFPDGTNMLIDGGGSARGMGIDPGRSAVAPYLWNHGIRRLDRVVATHPHPDHFGGLFYIISNFDVGEVWDGGRSPTSGYDRFTEVIAAKGITHRTFDGPGQMNIGGAEVQILSAPTEPGYDGGAKFLRENNLSVVIRIKYGEKSILFTGDAGKEEQVAMLAADPPLPLRSTVLKSPHHGGKSALNYEFLEAVSPSDAVISTSRTSNRVGIPRVVTGKLEDLGTRVYNTGEVGAVIIRIDGKVVNISTYQDTAVITAGNIADEWRNWRVALGI